MGQIIDLKIKPRMRNDPYCERFDKWLKSSRIGEKYCYFTGSYVSGSFVARVAYDAFELGFVTLYQKRVSGKFEYWAERI